MINIYTCQKRILHARNNGPRPHAAKAIIPTAGINCTTRDRPWKASYDLHINETSYAYDRRKLIAYISQIHGKDRELEMQTHKRKNNLANTAAAVFNIGIWSPPFGEKRDRQTKMLHLFGVGFTDSRAVNRCTLQASCSCRLKYRTDHHDPHFLYSKSREN